MKEKRLWRKWTFEINVNFGVQRRLILLLLLCLIAGLLYPRSGSVSPRTLREAAERRATVEVQRLYGTRADGTVVRQVEEQADRTDPVSSRSF